MNVGTSVFLFQTTVTCPLIRSTSVLYFTLKKLLKSMLLSKITNCLFFLYFVPCLINLVLSRAGTGAVKCRLLCLGAPSNRATIPAHKSWLGLEFCYQEEPLVIERERTDYIEPMLILSIFYFSYLGRSPTLLFAIKKHFC